MRTYLDLTASPDFNRGALSPLSALLPTLLPIFSPTSCPSGEFTISAVASSFQDSCLALPTARRARFKWFYFSYFTCLYTEFDLELHTNVSISQLIILQNFTVVTQGTTTLNMPVSFAILPPTRDNVHQFIHIGILKRDVKDQLTN